MVGAVYCLFVSMVFSLYAADDSSPFVLMESPYAGTGYADLHDMFDSTQKMYAEGEVDWNNAPYALGKVSISQGTAARCLQVCEVITPCAVCCMASNGCAYAASGLAIICGLRKVSCVKKCCKVLEPISFEDSRRGRILTMHLSEIQREMMQCPAQEKKDFVRHVLSKTFNTPSRSSSRSPARSPSHTTKEKID